MSLKAVLFDFNGVILKDESIHQQLIEEILLGENLRPSAQEYKAMCLGRSDRACLRDILLRRGRVVSEDYLSKLIANKAQAYKQRLEALDSLPICPGVEEFINQLWTAGLLMGVVTGASRAEVNWVCDRLGLAQAFHVIVAGDDLTASKPEPDGYLLAVERLNRLYPDLQITPHNCLAIEDTPAGITAAKRAGMQVVGVANTYPLHMLQRQANWSVDYLPELEIERVKQVFSTAGVSKC